MFVKKYVETSQPFKKLGDNRDTTEYVKISSVFSKPSTLWLLGDLNEIIDEWY